MRVFCAHLQSLDNQVVNTKQKSCVQEKHVLKLSKSMFEIVKHTV